MELSESGRQPSSGPPQNTIAENGSRRERAAPAAQACETCRSRKSRCDEGRPLCGTCKKLGLDCRYREPQVTKKDKGIEVLTTKVNELRNTQVHISADIKGLKQSLDLLTSAILHGQTGFGGPATTSTQSAMAISDHYREQQGATYEAVPFINSANSSVLDHTAAFRQVLTWPKISDMISSFAATSVESQNTALRLQKAPWSWLQQIEMLKHPHPLPSDGLDPTTAYGFRETSDVMSSMTAEVMRTYSNVYFATFGKLWAHVIPSDEFETSIMPRMVTMSFDCKTDQTIVITAMLVFALGKAAMSVTFGDTIYSVSRTRGETADSPPGLDLFNGACERIKYMTTQPKIESIRVHLLMALFYEFNCRHMDFWRCIVNASMCVQALGRCAAETPEDVDSRDGFQSLLKGLHYVCYTIEQSIGFVFGLPKSGITSNHSHDQSPNLTAAFLKPGDVVRVAHTQALNGLFNMIDQTWSKTNTWAAEQSSGIASFEKPRGSCAFVNVLQELDGWREALPADLQWGDTDRFSFSSTTRIDGRMSMFSTEPSASYASLDDIAEVLFAATIRSGYYYTRYLAYRPAVYRALHNPEDVDEQDCADATKCLETALLWPISAYPCAVWKRVIPLTFIWTQVFIEILLLFYVAQENPILQPAVRDNLNTAEINRTIALLMDWLKDMEQIDGLAGSMCATLTSMYVV